MAENEGFLHRWSRRKLAEKEEPGEAEGTARDEAAVPEPPETSEAAQAAAEDGERERHPAEDIDIDSLTAESDFSIFMQKGVPSAVRQKALRKLWTANPVYAGKEPLNDLFDLADAKTWGLGPVRATAWKVGQGYGVKDVLPSGKEETPAGTPAADGGIARAQAKPASAEPEDAVPSSAQRKPEEAEAPEDRTQSAAHSEDEDDRDQPA